MLLSTTFGGNKLTIMANLNPSEFVDAVPSIEGDSLTNRPGHLLQFGGYLIRNLENMGGFLSTNFFSTSM